jgi:hypothetical protein
MRRLLVRTALAAFAVATLGACVTIPERAWDNGRGMSATREYQMKMGQFGYASPGELFSTQRSLYVKSNPLSVASPVRYTPTSRYYDR